MLILAGAGRFRDRRLLFVHRPEIAGRSGLPTTTQHSNHIPTCSFYLSTQLALYTFSPCRLGSVIQRGRFHVTIMILCDTSTTTLAAKERRCRATAFVICQFCLSGPPSATWSRIPSFLAVYVNIVSSWLPEERGVPPSSSGPSLRDIHPPRQINCKI